MLSRSLAGSWAKINMFKTPEIHLYFDSEVSGGCLTIIVGSIPYVKFLAKINSEVRRK